MLRKFDMQRQQHATPFSAYVYQMNLFSEKGAEQPYQMALFNNRRAL